MADNSRIEVIGCGKQSLKACIELVTMSMGYSKFAGWSISDTSLIIHWCKPDNDKIVNIFPCPLTLDTVTNFCWEWLESRTLSDQPDHDGDNSPGFWFSTSDNKSINSGTCWHNPGGHWSGYFRVTPAWLMHGKSYVYK